ncbi:MAG: MFS transporter [Myxococcales bacterium FL481]|nr:MAG: MFS transporter [Myxococcales bacterium FL481]
MSGWKLVSQRRFGPMFWTQFLGALNDNVFKNALILWLTFSATDTGLDANTLVNVGAGLFIAPFFFVSAFAGQLADKLEKSRLIRAIKLLEIGLMVVAAAGLYLQHAGVLLAVLMLMGTQSALFGPVKYGILPQVLNDEELVSGNALVEMGTFAAILLGTIAGGALIAIQPGGRGIVAAAIVGLAVLGWLSARWVPPTPAADPELRLGFSPWRETWATLGHARASRPVFLSILGISWFWLCGALVLAQIPGFAKDVLGGDESVVIALLTIFSIGVGVGSFACERASGAKVEPGLVPLGALGISIFAIDMHLASLGQSGSAVSHWTELPVRLGLDLMLLGAFGGLFIVPLYAIIQQRSPAHARSRVIAANNILNAGFMVVAAIAALLMLDAGWTIPEIFSTMAIVNLIVAVYIFTLVPEFTLRFVVWLLMHSVYRLRTRGTETMPDEGAVLVVCNHVSFVDALILAAGFRRPLRFVMDVSIYRIPILHYLFKAAGTIPIAPKHRDEAVMLAAFDAIDKGLAAGDAICIFPEGKLTKDGNINEFRSGVERILARHPVPVLPVALRGLWGSLFSRKEPRLHRRRPRRWRSHIEIECGTWLDAEEANRQRLQAEVGRLRGDWR